MNDFLNDLPTFWTSPSNAYTWEREVFCVLLSTRPMNCIFKSVSHSHTEHEGRTHPICPWNQQKNINQTHRVTDAKHHSYEAQKHLILFSDKLG